MVSFSLLLPTCVLIGRSGLYDDLRSIINSVATDEQILNMIGEPRSDRITGVSSGPRAMRADQPDIPHPPPAIAQPQAVPQVLMNKYPFLCFPYKDKCN